MGLFNGILVEAWGIRWVRFKVYLELSERDAVFGLVIILGRI